MLEGDIYYQPSVAGKPLRLTTTEQGQNVVNGISDWTYEGRWLITVITKKQDYTLLPVLNLFLSF